MIIETPRQAATATAVGLVAVLAPMINLWRASPRDSFPLSHYPMFSARRGAHVEVSYLCGVRADGSRQRLDSRLAADGGMNQERKQIARAVRRGRSDRLARRVARRLDGRSLHGDVVAVEIVTGTFRIEDHFERPPGAIEPVDIIVAARHAVPKRGAS